MLCVVCSRINLDDILENQGYRHQATFADLCKSADGGCELCIMIRDAALNHDDPPEIAFTFQGEKQDHIYLEYDPFYSDPDRLYHFRVAWPGGKHSTPMRINTLCYLDLFADNGNTPSFPCGLDISKTSIDSALASIVPGRRMHMDCASASCLNLAHGWLSSCLAGHTTCRDTHSTPPSLPTRVIDVGPADGSHEPFLFVSEGTRGDWITLSYCWGASKQFQTTKATLGANTHSIRLTRLPQVFQDAIFLTRTLGYRYLWIDALCIIQDDPNDWTAEAALMGNIYKNCVLAIAADASSDSQEGIFQSANKGRVETIYPIALPVKRGTRGIPATIYLRVHDPFRELISPLEERGWTLQEGALSPRLLRFAQDTIRWECRSIIQTEEYPVSATDNSLVSYWEHSFKHICLDEENFLSYQDHPRLLTPARNIHKTWDYIVKSFTRRRLTYEVDNLPAISALARETARLSSDNYVAGLWRSQMLTNLLWYTHGDATRTEEYVAPSWSWASLKMGFEIGFVHFDSMSKDMTWLSEVIEMGVVNSGVDPFGRLSGGHVKLRGPTRRMKEPQDTNVFQPVELWEPFYCSDFHNSHGLFQNAPRSWQHCKLGRTGSIWCFHDTMAGDKRGKGPSFDDSAIYIQINRLDTESDEGIVVSALVLEPCHGDRDQCYRRAGYATLLDKVSHGWKIETVTII